MNTNEWLVGDVKLLKNFLFLQLHCFTTYHVPLTLTLVTSEVLASYSISEEASCTHEAAFPRLVYLSDIWAVVHCPRNHMSNCHSVPATGLSGRYRVSCETPDLLSESCWVSTMRWLWLVSHYRQLVGNGQIASGWTSALSPRCDRYAQVTWYASHGNILLGVRPMVLSAAKNTPPLTGTESRSWGPVDSHCTDWATPANR